MSNRKRKNNFTIVKVIGVGGFSKVYEVRDNTFGNLYAMKVVDKSNIEKENKVRQLIVEKKITEQLKQLFIVSLHSAFQTVYNIETQTTFCDGVLPWWRVILSSS